MSDLRNCIVTLKYVDAIWDAPCDPNSAGLEGLFYKRTFDAGDTKTAAVICYEKALLSGPDPMEEKEAKRRFIFTKEMSHIFDMDGEITVTPTEIAELMSGLISEAVFQRDQLQAEQNARLLAIEMIIPYERRMALRAQGPVTGVVIAQLAKECCFPAGYARIAMDPAYNRYIQGLRRKAKLPV